jgi:hypothetical protein
VAGMRALHALVFPHLPAPKSDRDVLAAIHHARTQAEAMPFKARAWSHHWLVDNNLPSGLPDHLKPRAEQVCPRVAEVTGFSANFRSRILRPIKPEVEAAVTEVILDEYSGRVVRHDRLKGRMLEAKEKAIRRLAGIRR